MTHPPQEIHVIQAIVENPHLLGDVARSNGDEVEVLAKALTHTERPNYQALIRGIMATANPQCLVLLLSFALKREEADDLVYALLESRAENEMEADLLDIGMMGSELEEALNNLLETTDRDLRKTWDDNVTTAGSSHWLRDISVACLFN